MRITLLTVGRLKAGPERELCKRYETRLAQIGRGIGLDGPKIVELGESQARRPEDRMTEEARALLADCSDKALLIALDERGRTLSSGGFARRLGDERDGGRAEAILLIGGADGLDAAIRSRAALTLSFGAMTIPHQLVRVLVLEQLYRAATILAGHPYHRE